MAARIAAFFSALSLVTAVAIPDSAATKIIHRDIVILGGGASGSHAALRLREDYNKTIIVVEKQSRIGGHVATFTDPETGNNYDYGVNSYTDYTGAREFVARLNIPVMTPARLSLTTTYADFTTGKLTNYSLPASADITAALRTYLELCETYEENILPSYAKFPNATEGIPEDLTMPFIDFVKKYDIEAAVPRIFQVTGLGMDDFAHQSTLYVMQTFGAPITRSFLGVVGSFVPASKRNQDIYDAIAELLGDDVMYSSTAMKTARSDNGVEVLVKSADNTRTLIRAKKLLISFEPTLHNMQGIDIDEEETSVFEKWNWSTVYAGIVSHPAIPKLFSYTNTAPSRWLSLPELPFVGRFDYLGDDNYRVLVGGDKNYNSCEAQKLVKRSLKQLAAAGTVPSLGNDTIQIKAWADHGAMQLHFERDDLKAGAITQLYTLQGRKSTYFTGGAWSAQFTTILWETNNQYVLPKLLAEF
ncbi:Beta-cyclopiazonate dehydrogenase [Colletotrichum gloeosporioides]|uniref:Beta-cyclopiazonate dehydrogenase n=1 Tax=Colletotrichum gloeosporioides TaxID=474922 RepID=A0A8H4CTQ4_COLGL|nr:Beta-cyclopiazonate dehydrogenase [Colletotrichum gloeosporioides]KAF3809812.1 Beta-cyclopiazonate dehydrogenase [Colletotrichum gloeosporioides]